MKVVNVFLLIALFITSCTPCAYSALKEHAEVKKGDVVYSFSSGKMQCLSEMDSNDHTFILLKTLDKNTVVDFKGLYFNERNELVLVLTMLVDEKTDLCASWKNLQEVSIGIEPSRVEKTNLTGKIVFEHPNFTVMIAE